MFKFSNPIKIDGDTSAIFVFPNEQARKEFNKVREKYKITPVHSTELYTYIIKVKQHNYLQENEHYTVTMRTVIDKLFLDVFLTDSKYSTMQDAFRFAIIEFKQRVLGSLDELSNINLNTIESDNFVPYKQKPVDYELEYHNPI